MGDRLLKFPAPRLKNAVQRRTPPGQGLSSTIGKAEPNMSAPLAAAEVLTIFDG